MSNLYEGFYARFQTVSKSQGSMLMNADHLVGDDYEVYFKTEDEKVVAWVRNKFGEETGYFDADVSRKLRLANAREQTIRAVLALVGYSDEPGDGVYWGQMAIFCFNPRYADEVNGFIDRVAASFKKGVRPVIDLGSQTVDKMISDPTWFPNDVMPSLYGEKGTAILKDELSLSEKIVEQARAKNKGCYVLSWLFIIAVIALFVYGLHLVGLF